MPSSRARALHRIAARSQRVRTTNPRTQPHFELSPPRMRFLQAAIDLLAAQDCECRGTCNGDRVCPLGLDG